LQVAVGSGEKEMVGRKAAAATRCAGPARVKKRCAEPRAAS